MKDSSLFINEVVQAVTNMNNITTARISAMAFAAVLTVSGLTLIIGQEADAQRNVANNARNEQNQRIEQSNGVVQAAIDAAVNAQVQTGNVCVQALAADSTNC